MNPPTPALGRADRIMRDYACLLDQADDLAEVGGKAHNLARLRRLGVPVPPGFVVTARAFRAFLDADGLGVAIRTLSRKLDPTDLEAVSRVSRAIRGRIAAARVPAAVRAEAIALRTTLLAEEPLAVRSSAVGEDSATASFAGQLDSYLGVHTEDELERALLGCWASYWSERSLAYQGVRGVRLRGMGVIVQALVRSRISGVLFTQAPERNGDDRLLGEYVFGYGDALVAGRVDPGRFTITRADFRWTVTATPEQPDAGDATELFNPRQMATLAETALLLERELGGPQDVEWTLDEAGRLYVVQSRPVTARGPAMAAAPIRRAEAADRRLVRWSNANVSENFPSPIPPLLYSIASRGYYHYFRNLAGAFGLSRRRISAMEASLRGLIGVHGARMYYNLTAIHAVLETAPFGRLLGEAFDQFVGAPPATAPRASARDKAGLGRGRLGQLGELAVIAARTAWQYIFVGRRVARFERTVAAFAARTDPAVLRDRSLPELLGDLRGFLDIRCHRWTDAALADAGAMVCSGLLRKLLAWALPGADDVAVPTTLLTGLNDVVSSRPVVELWALSRRVREDAELTALILAEEDARFLDRLASRPELAAVRTELEAFLTHWGFRFSGELMLTVPSFQEDPVALLPLLRAYVLLDGESPADVLRRQAAARHAATARTLGLLARRRLWPGIPGITPAPLVRRVLAGTQRMIVLRERARLKQALLYSRCRRIVLAMGARLVEAGRLHAREDVFFLTVDELEALASGRAMFPDDVPALIALRRAAHGRLGAMTPPDTFTLPEGAYLGSMRGSAPSEPAAGNGSADELAGTSACGGRITAPATILTDLGESGRLRPGDVLVTRQTDPGWGPVFFLIGGLILERGGMLSHGAILAREYGIPSVVGVRDATRRIAPGRIVTVDGDRGRVHLD